MPRRAAGAPRCAWGTHLSAGSSELWGIATDQTVPFPSVRGFGRSRADEGSILKLLHLREFLFFSPRGISNFIVVLKATYGFLSS